MGSLSKISPKCKKCKYLEICKNKRLVACAYYEQPKVNKLTASNTCLNAGKIDKRDIYLDSNTVITIDVEDIKREFNGQFNLDLFTKRSTIKNEYELGRFDN